MNLDKYERNCEDYARIEQAIIYLEAHAADQPDLKEIAASAGLSEYHFQRLFTRWAGISPKRLLQFLTKENVKSLLAASSDVLYASYQAGLSSPSRLHDLFVQCEGVTPGEYKRQGQGVDIAYGFHPSPFGECLLAVTGRGICFLGFVLAGDRPGALVELQSHWPKATFTNDPDRTVETVRQIFDPAETGTLTLHLRGTNFQLKVWEALLHIPPGQGISYEALAEDVCGKEAVRAVGNAVAHNPVAYLIPCHRVLRKLGDFGGYRYGSARKKAILLRESVHE